jgi:pimeloyl-ACP methyl ester carboxylesterase
MTVYFLSGLGVDSRIFKHLTFSPNINTVFIDWLTPLKKEPLQEYARRIAQKIDTSQSFMLVGLSFGGILATEVIEFVQPQKPILISSVSRRRELPFYYKLAGFLKLNYLLPAKAVNRANWITYWLFGITEKRDKSLLNEILTNTNTSFVKWAVNEILNWKRTQAPANLIRIHGDKDKVLPIINFNPKYIIPDAGHFMIASRAHEISQVLEAEIGTT